MNWVRGIGDEISVDENDMNWNYLLVFELNNIFELQNLSGPGLFSSKWIICRHHFLYQCIELTIIKLTI